MAENEISPFHYDFSCGVGLRSINFNNNSLPNIVGDVYHNSFEFLIVPVVNDKHNQTNENGNGNTTKVSSFKPIILDTLLDSSYLKSVIVGKISKSILQLDSTDECERLLQENIFQREVSYCGHLSLPAVLLPNPTLDSINYSRKVFQSITTGRSTKYWIRFKINPLNISQQWKIWNEFRTRCGSHPRLSPVIELDKWNGADLPTIKEGFIDQWLGEQIKAIIIPIKVFLKNDAGFPTLSKVHQKFIQQTFKFNMQYIITGGVDSESVKPYYDYLSYLYLNQTPITECDRFEQPYLDFLQSPLQPLQDNLESQTYEVFELDPVKYTNYQKAIELAIKDLLSHKDKPISKHLTIIVVGAGRGPLIQCSIDAYKTVESELFKESAEYLPKNVKIIGIEKNLNAIVTLESKKETLPDWQAFEIEIISSDMRDWNPTYMADILVSELLGSFGDNELSPECLDGAQKYLNREHGISIPTWYTSYISPVQSSVLYNAVVDLSDHSDKSFETPYVVKPHVHYPLSESKPVFTFSHPNFKDKIINNSRYITIEFPISNKDSLIHGFVGYFDCCLYSNVHISTNPINFSTGMFSWFPIYFPIKKPIQIQPNSTIKLHFWRCVSPSKVWYEWSISSPESIEIHNIMGMKSSIGLQ